jgi:hypothetical protein
MTRNASRLVGAAAVLALGALSTTAFADGRD